MQTGITGSSFPFPELGFVRYKCLDINVTSNSAQFYKLSNITIANHNQSVFREH